MDKNEIKSRLCTVVDSLREEIEAYSDDIAQNAELGFFETRTSGILAGELEKLGLNVTKNIALTGIRADISSGKEGPKIGVIGELDGIICRNHPYANPDTGATHTCGHNLQTATILTVAKALAKTGLMSELSGTVSILGTPAEEFIEITQRKQMHDEGKIVYLCGKPEFIRLGAIDDIDMSMMVHAGENAPNANITIPDSGNGFRVFMLQFKGKQAHAAAAPEKGINALYAAVCGINAVNALRETFRDEDKVRVHYIFTKGGDSVNSVPDDIRIEGYVRAVSAEVIDEIFDKVMKAFKAGAASIGAECFVTSIPGDMPLKPSLKLNDLFAENSVALIGEENVKRHTIFAASTDMGDIMHIMPAVHAFGGGVTGALHSSDFKVLDFNSAVLIPAKSILTTIVDLLFDNAQQAKDIIETFEPVYTKEEYVAAMNARFFSEI
ncbi:MAG: amidohydrolase [Synergistaceae bacterium]